MKKACEAVNLEEKLQSFNDFWSPKIVSHYNDCDIMVVKGRGEFNWHHHDDTDDFFLVLKGVLQIELRDSTVVLHPGELFVVPKDVEHRPIAEKEVHLLLIEPVGVPNTGDPKTAAQKVAI